MAGGVKPRRPISTLHHRAPRFRGSREKSASYGSGEVCRGLPCSRSRERLGGGKGFRLRPRFLLGYLGNDHMIVTRLEGHLIGEGHVLAVQAAKPEEQVATSTSPNHAIPQCLEPRRITSPAALHGRASPPLMTHPKRIKERERKGPSVSVRMGFDPCYTGWIGRSSDCAALRVCQRHRP